MQVWVALAGAQCIADIEGYVVSQRKRKIFEQEFGFGPRRWGHSSGDGAWPSARGPSFGPDNDGIQLDAHAHGWTNPCVGLHETLKKTARRAHQPAETIHSAPCEVNLPLRASARPKGETFSSLSNTGYWREELAAPYYAFQAAGAVIARASPKGAKRALDPKRNERSFQTELR